MDPYACFLELLMAAHHMSKTTGTSISTDKNMVVKAVYKNLNRRKKEKNPSLFAACAKNLAMSGVQRRVGLVSDDPCRATNLFCDSGETKSTCVEAGIHSLPVTTHFLLVLEPSVTTNYRVF